MVLEQVLELDEFKFYLRDFDKLKVVLYNYFSFVMELDDLKKILKKMDLELKNLQNGNIVVDKTISFEEVKLFEELFKFKISHYFPLKNEINGRDAYYITKPVPLFGILGFGIVDRGTNIIELRPLNGCVFDCIHCSVNEERTNLKKRDFVVDYKYFIEYTHEFIKPKENKMFLFINPQGETMMYSKLAEFIQGLKKDEKVYKVAITTRLPFWNKEYIDKLISSGLDQFNLSLDTLNNDKYKMLVGKNFNVNNVIKFIEEYHDKVNILLTPVWFPGINDDDLVDVLELCKKYNLGFGLQNYVRHKFGRKLKEKSWEEFGAFYESLVNKVGYRGDHMFDVFKKDYKPRNIFNIGDIIEVEILFPGRMMNEFIAKYEDRILTVVNNSFKNIKIPSKQKVKIVRLNDNIAMATI